MGYNRNGDGHVENAYNTGSVSGTDDTDCTIGALRELVKKVS
ncbi:hypothetical protein [Selenomonas ruminantium]